MKTINITIKDYKSFFINMIKSQIRCYNFIIEDNEIFIIGAPVKYRRITIRLLYETKIDI